MTRLLFFFSFFVILSLSSLIFPKSANGFSLDWAKVYSTTGEPTSVEISPGNSNVVYASIRLSNDFDLLKSTDKGLTWTSIRAGLPAGQDINWISLIPTNDSIIAVSLWGSGIHLSEDAGLTWSKIYDSLTPRSVEIDPSNANKIYAGIGGNHDINSGVYITTDKGITWTKTILTGNNAQILIDGVNSNRVFADSDPNFFKTTDGGNTWTLLTIQHTFSNSIIDNLSANTIYTSSYDSGFGIYKSIDNGDSWLSKSDGFFSPAFRIAQDTDGKLYVTRYSYGGGVWRSEDRADTWQPVADPSWLSASTWGIDAREGRVIVGVGGIGLFAANTNGSPIGLPTPTPTPTPPPPPGPDPVVFIPGFGGSWSFKGLLLNQPTTYDDWGLTPIFTDKYYQPLLDAIPGTLVFGYDFRKPISDSAASLNSFLANKLPGQKANIAAHSMGGLVARYCFQKIPGCKDKITKTVTGGTPNLGALDAYLFWEGNRLTETDLMIKFAGELVLHVMGLPRIRGIDIIHNNIPGVRDLLPIFNYITGKPYTSLSSWGKNPNLESLQPAPSDLLANLTALSGTSHPTAQNFDVTTANWFERLSGLWIDGKPTRTRRADGDGTVLKTSSEILAASNKYYPVWHAEYFGNQAVIEDVKDIFGIAGTFSLLSSNSTSNFGSKPTLRQIGIIYTTDDASLTVTDEKGNVVGTYTDDNRVVFLTGPRRRYKVTVDSHTDQKVKVEQVFVQSNKPSFTRRHEENCRRGEKRRFNFD